MVLSMVLTTTKFDTNQVFEAMNTIDTSILKKWLKDVFGESMMTKRKAAFS